MSQIVKKVKFAAIGDVEIGCVMVEDEPRFNSIDLCTALGFETKDQRKQALKTHVHSDDKESFKSLVSKLQGDINPPLDGSVCNVIYVNESGLYSLAFGSRKPFARLFKRWVTSEVLPQISKTGAYVPDNYHYRRNELELGETDQKRWDEVRRSARGREDALHYKVVEFVRKTYPNTDLRVGGGEHFQTAHARMDAYLKGYKKGHPDLTISRPLPNGFHYVLAIEFKNPNRTGRVDAEQMKYHRFLKDKCNIETIVGHNYEDIIIETHDHYKEVFVRAQTAALTDKPKTVNFATNENPQYWCNKLKNHTGLQEECEKRGISKDELFIKTKREIASILITFDKEHINH